MALVTYVEHSGAKQEVDVANGGTVMQGAVDNMIDGIVAECGGGLACATCHCYIDEDWVDRVGVAREVERQMLESSATEIKPTSRLSCQVTVSDQLDGLVVHLPEIQF